MPDIFNPPTPPAPLPANLGPVTPFLAKRGEFVPTLGGGITLTLEGETVRAMITEVLSPDHIVAEVISITTGKAAHPYKKGSILACQRSQTDLGEVWVPIDERAVREQEAVERVRQQVAAEQTRKAAEARGVDLEPEVSAEPVPRGTSELPRKVLGPRRSKVARAG